MNKAIQKTVNVYRIQDYKHRSPLTYGAMYAEWLRKRLGRADALDLVDSMQFALKYCLGHLFSDEESNPYAVLFGNSALWKVDQDYNKVEVSINACICVTNGKTKAKDTPNFFRRAASFVRENAKPVIPNTPERLIWAFMEEANWAAAQESEETIMVVLDKCYLRVIEVALDTLPEADEDWFQYENQFNLYFPDGSLVGE